MEETYTENGVLLKDFTESLFKYLEEKYSFHVEVPKYLNSYFVFDGEENSIVHFHLTECPNWKFGIWWDDPKISGKYHKEVEGTFFAQYEETIDKFKPSYSVFCEKVNITQCGLSKVFYCKELVENIKFIHNEPYLAFCRDYNGWDFNAEYHTREEAKEEYEKYCFHRDTETRVTSELDTSILSFVKEKILPLFHNATLYDHGENCYPRYEICALYKDNTDIIGARGLYDLSSINEKTQAIAEEFNTLLEQCDQIAIDNDIIWVSPIESFIYFYVEEE